MRTQVAASPEALVYRLAQLLIKLNHGEALEPRALAAELGVQPRTIRRDLEQRFAYLPLLRLDGRYQLEPGFIGTLSTADVERFASLGAAQGAFAALTTEFLRDVFALHMQSSLLVEGPREAIPVGREADFRLLERAIVARHRVAFDYLKDEGLRGYADLVPFRLVEHKGTWYLAARDGEQFKTFSLARIERPRMLEARFDADPAIVAALTAGDDVWTREARHPIELVVSGEVARHFRQGRVLEDQSIEAELAHGALHVRARVRDPERALALVRSWIPHARILSPDSLRVRLERELLDYLRQAQTLDPLAPENPAQEPLALQ